MDFRNFIEDDRKLSEYIKSFGTAGKVQIVVDASAYELQRLRAVADKINFECRTRNIEASYDIVLPVIPAPVPEPVVETVIEEADVVDTRKKNNERTKKTSSTD